MSTSPLTLYALLAVLAAVIVTALRRWLKLGRAAGFQGPALWLLPGIFSTLVFFMMFVVEAVFVQIDPDRSLDYVQSLDPERVTELSIRATLLGLFGFVAFAVAYESVFARALSGWVPMPRINQAPASRVMLVLGGLLALSATGVYQFGLNRLFYMMLNPEFRGTEREGYRAAIFLIEACGMAAMLAYAYASSRPRTNGWFKLGCWLLPLPLLCFGRTELMQVWLGMAVIRLMGSVRLPRWVRTGWPVIVLVMVTFVTAAWSYRNITMNGGTVESPRDLFREEFVKGLRMLVVPYDSLLAYLDLQQGGDFPTEYGKPLVDIVLRKMPESVVQDKPTPINIRLRQHLYPRGEGGIPFTYLGFCYANLGFAGVVIGLAILGGLLGAVQYFLAANRHQLGALLIYAVMVPLLFKLQWGVVQAGIVQLIAQTLRMGIGIVLLHAAAPRPVICYGGKRAALLTNS